MNFDWRSILVSLVQPIFVNIWLSLGIAFLIGVVELIWLVRRAFRKNPRLGIMVKRSWRAGRVTHTPKPNYRLVEMINRALLGSLLVPPTLLFLFWGFIQIIGGFHDSSYLFSERLDNPLVIAAYIGAACILLVTSVWLNWGGGAKQLLLLYKITSGWQTSEANIKWRGISMIVFFLCWPIVAHLIFFKG